MLEICRGRLEGFGPTLAAEKLAEVGLKIDHETLRRWLMVEGIWRKKKKRGPHRKWRPPKEHFGELVQMDGSFHDWLETGEKPCLLDMVDDATAKMGGEFFEQETTEGAMRVLWQWIERYGIPRALYTDHKNVYVTDREPTPDEQLAGQPALEDVFVFEEQRTVQNDWTVCWDSRWFQITGPKGQMPRRRERIAVRRRLDGCRVLLYRGRALEFHEIQQRPPRPAPLIKPASVATSRPVWVPPADHPWKRPLTGASAQAARERQLRASLR